MVHGISNIMAPLQFVEITKYVTEWRSNIRHYTKDVLDGLFELILVRQLVSSPVGAIAVNHQNILPLMT